MVYYAYAPDDYSANSAWHHGVSGQKWGVRNGPPYPVQSGTKATFAKSKMTKSTLANFKKQHKAVSSEERKRLVESRMPRPLHQLAVSRLTDEQLKARVERLELEKKYKNLLRESRGGGSGKETEKKNKGEQQTKSGLSKFGELLVSELVVKPAATYAQARLTTHAANVAQRNQAKVDYKADLRRQKYENKAAKKKATSVSTAASCTQTGKRVLNAAFSVSGERGNVAWGYDDDLPY